MDPKEEKQLPEEPDSLDHRVMKALVHVGRGHRGLMEKRVSKTGVYRGQHHLLMEISAMPNASQKELAEREHVSGATVAVSLKKLEKGGYIERGVAENDNRYHQIRITEKGSRVVDKSIRIFRKTEEDLMKGFSEEEKEQFLEYLYRVYRNIEDASKTESEGKNDEAL